MRRVIVIGIIKDMDFLLELFSDTLVSFAVKGERL